MSFFGNLSHGLLTGVGAIPKSDFRLQIIADHPAPESIAPGWIYIVESKGFRKWAYLRCPSLPAEIIQLSLMSSRRPNWTITADWLGRPTLYPSIRQLEGSFAHFWIRSGRIDWCIDTGQPHYSALRTSSGRTT